MSKGMDIVHRRIVCLAFMGCLGSYMYIACAFSRHSLTV